MPSVDLDQAEFYGRVSTPPAEPQRTRATCLGCGSSLAGRAEGIQSFGGKLVRIFGCPCGRKRREMVASR